MLLVPDMLLLEPFAEEALVEPLVEEPLFNELVSLALEEEDGLDEVEAPVLDVSELVVELEP